jgi:rubrerythrin
MEEMPNKRANEKRVPSKETAHEDEDGENTSATGKKEDSGSEAGDETVEADLDEVELLTTLARLDLEAALAYAAGAGLSADAVMAKQLEKFRGDHLRHFETLNRLITERGGEALDQEELSERPLLAAIARMAAPLGAEASVITLLANEHVTNGSYEVAMEYDWDDDVLDILESHFDDEQRHFEWLSKTADQFAEEAHPEPSQPLS